MLTHICKCMRKHACLNWETNIKIESQDPKAQYTNNPLARHYQYVYRQRNERNAVSYQYTTLKLTHWVMLSILIEVLNYIHYRLQTVKLSNAPVRCVKLCRRMTSENSCRQMHICESYQYAGESSLKWTLELFLLHELHEVITKMYNMPNWLSSHICMHLSTHTAVQHIVSFLQSFLSTIGVGVAFQKLARWLLLGLAFPCRCWQDTLGCLCLSVRSSIGERRVLLAPDLFFHSIVQTGVVTQVVH